MLGSFSLFVLYHPDTKPEEVRQWVNILEIVL